MVVARCGQAAQGEVDDDVAGRGVGMDLGGQGERDVVRGGGVGGREGSRDVGCGSAPAADGSRGLGRCGAPGAQGGGPGVREGGCEITAPGRAQVHALVHEPQVAVLARDQPTAFQGADGADAEADALAAVVGRPSLMVTSPRAMACSVLLWVRDSAGGWCSGR